MIQLKRLTKCYGQDEVVSDLTLAVSTGEILVVLGGSGSGKTTILKMINRLVEPTTGTVQINGTDTSTIPPHQLRRQIGYVFQQVGLFPHMTVSENVAVTPSLLGWKPARIRDLVDELLDGGALDASHAGIGQNHRRGQRDDSEIDHQAGDPRQELARRIAAQRHVAATPEQSAE